MNAKPILGLIGGIGSGKSLVAEEFAKHGGYLISGDSLGHEALAQEDIRVKIIERWGRELLDEQGRILRRKLGTIVFADGKELRALEALVFPFIEMRIREEIARAGAAPFIILDAAVMMESGWDRHFDKIVFVDAPEVIRLRRLWEQRGWTEAEVKARDQSQLPVEDKRRRADYVIDNAGPPEQMAPQVIRILEELTIN
jgi:dephospho-CoA kinase